MEPWKRTVYICLIGAFLMSVGVNQLAPILPLYFHLLGVENPEEISMWSGLAMGVTFIVCALVAPFWGRLADRKGRKITLLRASFGMALCNIALSFAQSPEQIVFFRLIQGCVNGFFSGSIALIATETPQAHTGWALGILTSANLAGSLVGPFIGGYISSVFGIRQDFFIVGILMLVAFFSTLLFVKEDFTPGPAKEKQSFSRMKAQLPDFKTISMLYVATLILSICIMCLQPVITVYIKGMMAPDTPNLALIAGAVFSIMGIAQMMSSSFLGKLVDRIGPKKVLIVALMYSGLLSIPQAYVTDVYQLAILRFLQGCGMGGLLPALNTYLSSKTPKALSGQVFAYNQSMQFIGLFIGAIGGSQLMAHLGFTTLFWMSGLLFIICGLWIKWKI